MKVYFKKVFNGLVAAATSPENVKKEKSAAVFITGRILLSLGASAGTVSLVAAVYKILGF